MKNILGISGRLAVVIAAIFLAGCGSAPTIQEQKLVRPTTAKVSQVFFFYQDAVLTTNTTYYGRGVGLSINETGLDQFGNFLTTRAKGILEKQGVQVSYSGVVAAGQWPQESLKIFSGVPRAQLNASHLLVVTPQSGSGAANIHSSNISMVFKVRLIEGANSAVIWEGLVAARTWKGKDFIMKNIQETKFDGVYADLFLMQIVEGLKQNGLL